MCRKGNVKDITSGGKEMLNNYERFLLYREIKCLIADYDKCRHLPTKNEVIQSDSIFKKVLKYGYEKRISR